MKKTLTIVPILLFPFLVWADTEVIFPGPGQPPLVTSLPFLAEVGGTGSDASDWVLNECTIVKQKALGDGRIVKYLETEPCAAGGGGTECSTSPCSLNTATTIAGVTICRSDGTNCQTVATDLNCADCIGGPEIDENALSTVPSAADLICTNCISGPEIDESGLGTVPSATSAASAADLVCVGCVGATDIANGQITPSHMAVTDFGDFSCGGITCNIDAGAISGAQIGTNTVTGTNINESTLDVPLGTATSGNYVQNISVGTGLSCVNCAAAEGQQPTISSTFGASIGPTEMEATSFGDFVCNGSVCRIFFHTDDIEWGDPDNAPTNGRYDWFFHSAGSGAPNDPSDTKFEISGFGGNFTITTRNGLGGGLFKHVGDAEITQALSVGSILTVGNGADSTEDISFNLSGANDPKIRGRDGMISVQSTGNPTIRVDDEDIANAGGGHSDVSIVVSCSAGPNCLVRFNRSTGGLSFSQFLEAALDGGINLGDSSATDFTVVTDGTGDSEVVLPDNSIGSAEVGFNFAASSSKGGDATNALALEGVDLGTLTDGRTCTYDAANTEIDCDTVSGGAQNLFETINAPSGTDPVADSPTDTLNLAASGIVTIVGDLTTDTVTIGAVEVDGSVTNEIEVVDEVYSAANFNGDTTSAVSQDDFYDYNTISDTDDDGLPNRVDANTNGVVTTTGGDGTLSVAERPLSTVFGHAPGTSLATIFYFGPRTGVSAGVGSAGAIVPITGTAKNFCCNSSSAPGGGESYVWTFNYHATNYNSLTLTSLTCTTSGADDVSCCDTTNSASVAQEGFWVFSVDGSTGATATATVSCSVMIY